MNNTYKLLIIEDDKDMCEVLSNPLNKEETRVLKCNDLLLNLDSATLIYNENSLELTKNEMTILKTLMESKGKGVSKGI